MRALIYICALLVASASLAQVSAKAVLSPPNVPIYRTAKYVVELEGPKGLTTPALKLAESLKGVDVSTEPTQTVAIDETHERLKMTFTLDAKEPGTYTIPAAKLDLGNNQSAEIPALTLVVHEATEDEVKQAAEFVDIADPAVVAPPQAAWWLYAIMAVVAFGVVGALVWYWRTHRTVEVWTPPVLKPWQVAHNRLEELSSRRLPQQGRFEPYYVDLSAILRYYIEDRFHLRAPERTTPEFLEEASRAGVLNETHQAMLAQFLRHCDRVKFARYEPSFEEMEKSFDVVKQFVVETTPAPTGVEPVKEPA